MLKYYKYISDNRIKKGFSLTEEARRFANDAGFSQIYKKDGRPRVDGGYVSCTHSFDRAYMVFSDRKVGIDCEKLRTAPIILKKLLASPSDRCFFERWTLLESVSKMTGIPVRVIIKKGLSDIRNLDYNTFEDDGFIVTIARLI